MVESLFFAGFSLEKCNYIDIADLSAVPESEINLLLERKSRKWCF